MPRKGAVAAMNLALRGMFFASLGLASTSVFAGDRLFTFDDDSTAELAIFTNTADPVRAEDGQSGGYLAITDAINSKYGVVIFPDIDDGRPVAAFTLEADVRIGHATGNGGRPADGLSVSYARANDPLIVNGLANANADHSPNTSYNIQAQMSVNGAAEMGASTGVVVSFDTWQGNTYRDGSSDVEGLMVQVDGKVVKTYGLPTRNGTVDDITSLETGTWDAASAGKTEGLGWAKLKVDLAEDGKLSVFYKNATILDKFQTAFYPSAGRIVFAGRTGGANAIQHVDNVHLVTKGATYFTQGFIINNAIQFRAVLTDNQATGSLVDASTATFKLDDVAITPNTHEKIGDDTIFYFTLPIEKRLASGSTHSLLISAKDTNNALVEALRVSTAPGYTLIPEALSSGIDPATAERGFKYRAQWQKTLNRNLGNGDVNRTFQAERQIHQGFLGADGLPLPNDAVLDGADENGYLNIDGVVNIDQNHTSQGNFRAPEYPETDYPGITPGDPNSFTVEFSGYAYLQPGAYTFGVNSDDGFKHTVGRGLSDAFGVRLGEFDGGRGASDSVYDVVVTKAGLYPMRWLQWEGGGGANVEIFTKTADGVRHLVNNDADPASVQVFRSGLAKSYIRQTSPLPNTVGGVVAEAGLTLQVVDGATPAGPLTVKVDGIVQSGIVTKEGNVTTFHIDYVNGQDPGDHVVEVAAGDLSASYRYNVAFLPKARGSDNFVIEAEDFDNNGSNGDGSVNTMPYLGGAFNGQDAILGVDFFDNDVDSNEYRAENGGVQKVAITPQNVNNNLDQRNRGSWDATSNWRIGWIGGDNWYSYHRTIPAGDYTVYAALSRDNTDFGGASGRLAIVNAADDIQTLGTFNGYGSGAWGMNNLISLGDVSGSSVVSGSRVVYHSDGTEKNFRFFANSGDFDYLAFVPLRGVTIASSPASAVPANGPLAFTFLGNVDKASVAITVDGKPLTLTSSDIPNGVSVSGTSAAAIGAPLSSHSYVLSFKDTDGQAYSKSASFKITDGTFLIEAEDYNFGRGQTSPKLNTMPYYGNALLGTVKAAVEGIDVGNRDGDDSNSYLREEANQDGSHANININWNIDGGRGEDNDVNRGPWDVTSNYKIGWTGGGDWHNYTRDIPAGDYQVWMALSFDSQGDHDLRASLQRVTGDTSAPDQTVEQLGTFDGKGTASYGGWGANRLVQMKDSAGQPAVVSLSGGSVTLRASIDSGDFDYFKLVPTGAPVDRPRITSLVKNLDGTLTITWTGGGTLQASPTVNGPWQDVTGATSPFTFTPTAAQLFGRIKK